MLNKLKDQLIFPGLVLGCCLIANLAVSLGQEEFKYDAKGKRNPFIPLVTPEGKLIKLDTEIQSGNQGLSLEGIIYDKLGISYAIVNSTVVRTGDFVGDYQILKIENNKIILIRDGLTSEIELKKGDE